MKNKEIKELLKYLKENDLSEISYQDSDLAITLKKEKTVVQSNMTVGTDMSLDNTESAKEVIKAPLVGVFYDKATPESTPFVSVGTSIKKGDVLCIIEAMKVMNEVVSDRDGVIEKVLVEDGQAVSFDDVLFELK